MIRWSQEAEADLLDIQTYIAQDNEAAAIRIALDITDRAQTLDDHPLAGRKGRYPGTREWVLTGLPFVLVYSVGEGDVEIVAVLHHAQSWPPNE